MVRRLNTTSQVPVEGKIISVCDVFELYTIVLLKSVCLSVCRCKQTVDRNYRVACATVYMTEAATGHSSPAEPAKGGVNFVTRTDPSNSDNLDSGGWVWAYPRVCVRQCLSQAGDFASLSLFLFECRTKINHRHHRVATKYEM